MFHQEDGNFINARHLQHVFRRISTRAGLPPVHPHVLRHTWATHMLIAGAPLNYVSCALGHHSTAFTAATYAAAPLVDQPEGTTQWTPGELQQPQYAQPRDSLMRTALPRLRARI